MTLPAALADILRDPPRAYSPAAIWWWSGERLRRDRLRWQLERFAEGGVWNLVILNLAPSGPMFGSDADDPPFFSEEWWALLEQVCADAEELGISLWFYDQLGFSGADLQARLVDEQPRFAGRWLGPDGSVTTRGFDYLSAEACAVLIDRVHGEFERRLGHRLGGVIAGSFQDELPAVPTWSDTFAVEFDKRRGYDLTPHLPLLWADGARAGEIRRDYQRTRAELAEEAFFRPLAEWHARHGLLSGCDQQDPARAGHPVEGVQLYADYARTHRWFSAPGSDHHGDARVHSSLAHLYDRPRTWIEAFHSSGWGGTLEETFDWLLPWLRAGATLYNPHAVYYTTKAGWWEWAPPATDWRQPYWRHHRVFADAVTRLCAALSLGRHACDLAVLMPTATAQADTRLDGVGAEAARAQEVYREIVGDMAWFRMLPGVLDRLGLDADVIDDDSVQRATIRPGRTGAAGDGAAGDGAGADAAVGDGAARTRLEVADESYAGIVLPACTTLDPATEEALVAFADRGGLVVAVGVRPEGPLRSRVRFAATTADLGPLLSPLRRVEAPVPPLVREFDGATIVYLQATFPMASHVSVERPGDRGIDQGWDSATIDFDPARYAAEMPVRVRGVSGTPLLVDPFGGGVRALPYTVEGEHTEVVVPFDAGPAALLVFTGEQLVDPEPAASPTEKLDLGTGWEMELVPTLDDTWGDLGHSGPVLHRWEVEHRVDGLKWRPAYATFGSHGSLRTDGEEWRPAVYSTSRGIRKDPIHRLDLGPKGHVPEEFLDFGQVAMGRSARFRAELTVPEHGFLAVGAAAAKAVRIDGHDVDLDDRGYLALARRPLSPGSHLLEVRLVPEDDGWLRAHVAVVTDPEHYLRPEWITGPAGPTELTAAFTPKGTVLQVASITACRVLVNGVEMGRQGGFDPYADHRKPRVRRYDLAGVLRPGANEVTVRVGDGAEPVLVDGCVTSGPGWWAVHDGERVAAEIHRTQYCDPAALHLPRRPHPLPGTSWLSKDRNEPADPASSTGLPVVLPTVLAEPGTAGRVEWLRFQVPPGATALRVPLRGAAELLIDGQPAAEGTGRLEVSLDGRTGPREALLRVVTEAGHTAGAILTGPIEIETGPGPIELGDWERSGLPEYSGGVRYRRAVHLDERPDTALLDLGRVRGTAEVRVNGRSCGVRVCSPYRFDVGAALREGENTVEVEVYGTLAPHLDAVSPTHFVFPGQRVSGLHGPARLLLG
ncbi:glycosylhydrolase-like jelly roll fold domain-containing protein [Nonomuraea sp. NPDC049028]|uniref:glycosylhydrolase-like jelly roll fold domain-containing protein n=1 Tax=Nonomuraea sp. NPDC049028 TaxID=3364348 RepID=UPI0037113F4E